MDTSTQINTVHTVSDLPTSVVIQGYEGSFHHMAANFYFGGQQLPMVCADSFPQMMDLLTEGGSSFMGLMAIENTMVGSLLANLSLLDAYPFHIVGEVYLRIHQHLIGWPESDIRHLTEVASHPVALAQCQDFLRKYPNILQINAPDTALSVRELSANKQIHQAAIGSRLAATMYGLDILAEAIESTPLNYTRFLVLQHAHRPLEEADNKLSVSFTLEHVPGALLQLLHSVAQHKGNMTKLQSMPILGQPWQYRFFMDLTFEKGTEVADLILEMKSKSIGLRVLGTYQNGLTYDS